MTDLKPCPLCGGQAVMRETQYIDGGYVENVAAVECSHCGAKGSVSHECMPAEYVREEAAGCWNHRSEHLCHATVFETGPHLEDCIVHLSCGHFAFGDKTNVPNYCDVCGAKVIGE